MTQEQKDQLIDESGIKEREDYEEKAFNILTSNQNIFGCKETVPK